MYRTKNPRCTRGFLINFLNFWSGRMPPRYAITKRQGDRIRSHGTKCRLRATRNDLATLFITHKIFQILWGPMLAKSTWFRTLHCTQCNAQTVIPTIKLKSAQGRFEFYGRGDRIRTYDILLPKQALYQTELRPECQKL